ncbi:hypothetical protein H1R20_g4018, partial [Candolleomyces eurysporus]
MPAQSVSIALGTFIMTSIVCTFSYMTNQIVLKPKTWANCNHRAFAWRPVYVLPTVIFPAAALAAHVALVVKLRAVQPATEFYCDSSSPQWVRFLSYAGTPLLLSIPSLFLSIKTVLLVNATNRHIQRARTCEIDMDPPNSSSYYSDSYTGDGYTKPLRPKKFSLKRSFSAHRKASNKLKEKDSFDSDNIDAHLKSQTDSSPAGSLRFTVAAPTPRSSRTKDSASGVGGADMTTANLTAAGGPGVVKSPTTVHFHIPIKPPPSSRDAGVEGRSSGGGGGRAGCVSPSSVLSSDSEAASASSSPPLPAAGLAIYSTPENPDSNVTISEVHRDPSSFDMKASPYSASPTGSYSEKHTITVASTTTKDDSWRSVMELTNGQEEIKARRIVEWHVNHHGSKSEYSDNKGVVEDCTEEEDLEGEEDLKGEDDDTLSEELTARTLPKIRTHTKHFTNYSAYSIPFHSFLSSPIHRLSGSLTDSVSLPISPRYRCMT